MLELEKSQIQITNIAQAQLDSYSQRNKLFQKWAMDKATQEISKVQESFLFDRHGIVNVRVISSALLYKARFYAKLTLLRIPKADYQNSSFFQCLSTSSVFSFYQKEQNGEDLIFFVYTFIEDYTTKLRIISWARERFPEYGDGQIKNTIQQICPVFCKLVKFDYKVFKYTLEQYPVVVFPEINIAKIAEKADLKSGSFQVGKWRRIQKPHHYQKFQSKGDIEDALYYSRSQQFCYYHCRFLVEQSVVYWVQYRYGIIFKSLEENIYQKGLYFEDIYLLDGEATPLKAKGKSVNELIALLFQNNIQKVTTIYQQIPLPLLPNLFRLLLIDNIKQSAVASLQPGDILWSKTSDKLHLSVFISDQQIIHTVLYNCSEINGQNAQSFFKIQKINMFVDIQKLATLKVLRFKYMPFSKEEVGLEALKWSKKILKNIDYNRNYENMAFVMMGGKAFKLESGFREESIDQFIKEITERS